MLQQRLSVMALFAYLKFTAPEPLDICELLPELAALSGLRVLVCT